MSFSNGRRASIYPDISHLNTLPSEYDMPVQQQAHSAEIDLDADLSLFTDGEFFNFDMGDMTNDHSIPYSRGVSHPLSAPHSAFPNGDYQGFPLMNPGQSLPGHGDMKAYSPPVSADHSVSATPRMGEKRKAAASASSPEAKGSPALDENGDPVRAAAEEDKRRRNTAASARFRVKKKQREQAMEKTAKEMTDRVTFLENRVGQLESENKILRDLLTDKVGKDINLAKVLAESPKAAGAAKIEANVETGDR
ncbi:hypothetical protein FH972_025877 [Carpinus fangiana]|uniref:BZIP domain-containing protein n=1 Tax=Carpinus fangiana TaxID=176857 RepID=A0A5N6L2N9_9ROSI|nr:hypothetical protein FH972_025877 [Carpinus fangiana]